MAAISKREQARNEQALQDLLRQPGNSVCADCGARNPSWASWNLGIFVCMRCASIHRKLGTHISKVKSLSMDKWTADQVENMRMLGNAISNKQYNPKNKKPDIPLDADEVDSAMERFIRKKYQEKSLADGRPEPPARTAADPSPSLTQTSSFQSSPNLDRELPPTGKKHKFFGFSLRTSSKKDRPGMQEAFKITPVEYSPTSGRTREVPEVELQEKLAVLRDMGFTDNEMNLSVLRRSGGDLERTTAMLVKMGPTEPQKQKATPAPVRRAEPATSSAPASATTSNNPFDQLDQRQPQQQQASGFGLSFDEPQQQSQPQTPAQAPNANPWQAAMHQQQSTGLEQQFSGMQVSNPLFPHHTGGYTTSNYNDQRLQTMTPPVPSMPQQYGYTSSLSSNPFQQPQQPMSSQSTGNNPFYQQQQSQPVFAPSMASNPFLGMQQTPSQTGMSSSNPFGLPPQQQQQYMQSSQPQSQSLNPFGVQSQASPPPIQQAQTFPFPNQQQYQQAQTPQPQIPDFDYGQPQQPPSQPSQQQQQYQQHPLRQSQSQQAFYHNQQYMSQPQQAQPQQIQPQATGRYTKNDIMALFNQPPTFPQQQQLASVQEAQDDQTQAQQYQQQQQPLSPAPNNNPYGGLIGAQERAATMPVSSSTGGISSMHSSGGQGSRNPFFAQSQQQTQEQSAQRYGQLQAQTQQVMQGHSGQGYRHASNESVSVNNPGLMDGRHSPDAFASLSSRY